MEWKGLMKYVFAILLSISSFSAFAIPNSVRCHGENVLIGASKSGTVTFTFTPFKAVWSASNGNSKSLFDQAEIVCGVNIARMSTKPTCDSSDTSGDGYFKHHLTCDTQYETNLKWFAKGEVTINENNKSGRFECRTKFGTEGSIVIDLRDCDL